MLLTSYERDAIRPHVLGRFRDMLLATARHPAMLVLSRQLPVARLARRRPQSRRFASPVAARPGLNENYGRELLELHTLGVNGGYTQDDVINVARAFHRLDDLRSDPLRRVPVQSRHARSRREDVLGRTFPAAAAKTKA